MTWNDRRDQIWREMTTWAIADALDELCHELITEVDRLRKRDDVVNNWICERVPGGSFGTIRYKVSEEASLLADRLDAIEETTQ